ncbi:hypothetical protein [Bacillus sp. C30]
MHQKVNQRLEETEAELDIMQNELEEMKKRTLSQYVLTYIS